MLKIFWFLGLLAISAPVVARDVELIAFEARSLESVASEAGVPGERAGREPLNLRAEFDRLAPTGAAPPPVARVSSIAVPIWMRSSAGQAAVSGAVDPLPAGLAAACSWEPYRPNPRLSRAAELRRVRYYPVMAAAACEAGVPTHLLDALVTQESRYDPAARSLKGAIGLTQLMPATARQLGVGDPQNVLQNLRGGARYLRQQLDEFRRYDLALGAYNAGPGRIRQYRGLPPFRETADYVATVLGDVRTMLERSAMFIGSGRILRPEPASEQPGRAATLLAF